MRSADARRPAGSSGSDGSDDSQLVDRARRGDTEAFGQLVERYQRPLMGAALSYTRNVADADDMVQETFVRAFTHLSSFRERDRFAPWLHRILRNLLIDKSRRSWREVADDELLVAVEETSGGPENALLNVELSRALREAIDAIPSDKQRQVFQMRYFEGLPVKEIAQRLGVHSGTVKVHLFRSVQRLRQALGAMETAL